MNRLHLALTASDSGISMLPTARNADSSDVRGVQTQQPACSPRARFLELLTPLLLLLLALCPAGSAMGETFTISWAANSESDLGGYTVHLGTASGNYSSTYNAGNQTQLTLPPLSPSTTYYCAVQAYNIHGLTGAPSSEVSFTTSAATVTPAEILIEDDTGTAQTNGSSNLAFGSIVVGSSGAVRSLIITNTGGQNLSGLGFTLGGSHPTDFFVNDPGLTTLAPGESAALDILFDPTSVGSRAATLTITSNDADESSFVVSLLGTGTSSPTADISVIGPDGIELSSGGTGTSFGVVNLGSSSGARIYTLKNAGSAVLNNLAVSIDGANPSDFTVSGLSTTSLAVGASGTFSLTFTPGAAGNRTATLHLTSNDPDENPFNIQLAGTGGTVPEIGITKADGTELSDASASLAFGSANLGASGSSQTITIRNSGTAALSGIAVSIDGAAAADFTLSSLSSSSLNAGGNLSFTVTFKPGTVGARTAALHITSNDADENPFDISLGGTGVAVPEIVVTTAEGVSLTDAASSLDFGSVNLGGSGSPQTLLIKNTGSAALSGLALSLTGAGASDFVLSTLPGTSVAAGASSSISISFQPKSPGLRSAVLQIISNDSDESPFEITLNGTGSTVPQIEILDDSGNPITSGHQLSLGTVDLGQSTDPREIVILSTGTASLTGLGAALTGAHASDFSIQTGSATTLAPGESSSLFVSFKPTASGPRTATLTLTSNSRIGNSFVIQLTGTAAAHPRIDVLHPDGASLASGEVALGFPSINLGETSGTVVCTVTNTGTADLTNLTLVSDGNHAADFAISAPSSSILNAGQTATFSVTFSPAGTGTREASLRIASNDTNRGTITIPLIGKGVGVPELDVLLDGQSLAPARVSPVDFGKANSGDSGAVKTFTIRNKGSATLAGLKVTRSGTSAGDFVLSALETTTLRPGASTSFKVRFNPTGKGPREAMLTIAGNDAVASEVRVPLTGTSLPVPEMELKVAGGSVLTKNRAYIALADHGSKSLVITNRGNAPLTNLKLDASGIHLADFDIAKLKNTTLAPGKSATVRIRFDSRGKGNRWASLTVGSNDPETPRFEISLVGKGPSSAKSAPVQKTRISLSDTPPARPLVSFVRIDGVKYRCITIPKSPSENVRANRVEVSSNLVDWNSGKRFTTVLEDNESHLKVRDNQPFSGDLKRHIRYRRNR